MKMKIINTLILLLSLNSCASTKYDVINPTMEEITRRNCQGSYSEKTRTSRFNCEMGGELEQYVFDEEGHKIVEDTLEVSRRGKELVKSVKFVYIGGKLSLVYIDVNGDGLQDFVDLYEQEGLKRLNLR